jgi:hypothetical protein
MFNKCLDIFRSEFPGLARVKVSANSRGNSNPQAYVLALRVKISSNPRGYEGYGLGLGLWIFLLIANPQAYVLALRVKISSNPRGYEGYVLALRVMDISFDYMV